MTIERVGVVGCGLMGSGIAECCARAGRSVVVVETDATRVAAGQSRVESSLDRAVRAGKLTESERAEAWSRLSFTSDLEALAECDLVIEAVVEDADEKAAVFSALDRIVKSPSAILASNTSSIPIARLGAATSRPGSVVGLHFFNPVPVMPLVEIVAAITTDDAVTNAVTSFATDVLGKRPVAAVDRAGFIVNGLLIPYLLSAIRMLEAGFSSAEEIDRAMELGFAHPMGPLKLSDFIGLDTVLFIAQSMYDELKETALVAPPLLMRMVEAGRTGRKSGVGFYNYG